VLDAFGHARVPDAVRQALADPKPPVDCRQQQDAGVGGETAAIEGGENRLAGNR